MAILAINGGTPAVPGGLKVKWPIFDDTDRQALLKVFESGSWNNKVQIEMFTSEFARYHDAKYGLALGSGTVGLETGLRAGGIEVGDEVIVPALTFVATAYAVTLVNAIPIFVDVHPDTYCLDPNAVESAITPKTRAILTVHYGGYPSDMDRLIEIAERHNLFIVEDCAHAHGTEWRGRKVGAIGSAGAFSFNISKSLTAGEGGIMITNSREISSLHYLHHRSSPMTAFQAAVLRTQLKRLPAQVDLRHETGEYLATELEKIGGVRPLLRDPRITKRGYYFFIIRYDSSQFGGVSRDKFIEVLRKEGIAAENGLGVPLHKQPVFLEKNIGKGGYPRNFVQYFGAVDYSKVSCPVSEYAFNNEQITLDANILLGGKPYADAIINAIAKIKENFNELTYGTFKN
jgi:dTDP-4-amino-4,6-dideoxygalactose transaminase